MNRRPDMPPNDRPVQQGLFGPIEPESRKLIPVAPHQTDDAVAQLAAALPNQLYLGTSSWGFAGWRGIVYAHDASKSRLARGGLAAYAQHPLLNAVGLDRTFYAPISAHEYAEYAAAVPESFRFLVKAWGELTSPTVRGQHGKNPHYFDVDRAIDDVVAPAFEGLANRLGPLVFQFPPQGGTVTKRPEAFADRLHGFFSKLPAGLHYAIELRDEALLTERYVEALASTGARHCFGVHSRMPAIERQRELVPVDGPVAVRWMLHKGFRYEQAKERYEPFDQLVDPDPASRQSIVDLCLESLAAGHPVIVVVNNKAEGSAPLSIAALARAFTDQPF